MAGLCPVVAGWEVSDGASVVEGGLLSSVGGG